MTRSNNVKDHLHTSYYAVLACKVRLFSHRSQEYALSSTQDIFALCKAGRFDDALNVLDSTRTRQNPSIYGCILQGFAKTRALSKGKRVHDHIKNCGLESNVYVGNHLIAMYEKCGNLEDAWEAFKKISSRNVFSWTAIISAYAHHGHDKQALRMFQDMQMEGIAPDKIIFTVVLKAFTCPAVFAAGKLIHSYVIYSASEQDVIVGNALVNMYGKCGSLDDAQKMFNNCTKHEVVAWNIMISIYAQNGTGSSSLEHLHLMRKEGIVPDTFTFVNLLDTCSSLENLAEGKVIHAWVVLAKLDINIYVGTALLNMYSKCKNLDDACQSFNKICEYDIISWNAMIAAYNLHAFFTETLQLFLLMQCNYVNADKITFVGLVDACASLMNVEMGKLMHACIIIRDFKIDISLETSLVNMYGKFGSLQVAWMIFEGMQEHNIVSYTTMITALGQTGFSQFAFHLFQQMPANDIQADQVSIVSILNACDTLSGGRYIHACIVTNGLGRDDTVEAALILMYSKHGSLNDSQKVMNKLETVLSWNAMLAAYAQHGYESMVFELYENMQENNILPDKVTFTIMIAACTNMTTLTEGRCVHAYIVSNGLESDIVIGNALVNMYGKCGQLEDANAVFLKMPQWNAASWNAIIANFCQYGEGEMAIGLFQKIYREGMMPNQITFLSVLSACSHAGLVDEASHLFVYMPDHAMEEHYGCMVDLLGHVGWLEEAEELMSGTPFHHCALLWKTLLAVCRIHGDVERAKSAAGHVLDFDPEDATAYILLANIYADVYTGKPLDAGSIFL